MDVRFLGAAAVVPGADGLADPGGYLRRLHERTGGAWTVVEKILGADERLPAGWPVAGTTGYDALRRIDGLFVDPEGAAKLNGVYRDVTQVADDAGGDWAATVRRAAHEVVEHELATEVDRLVRTARRVIAHVIADSGADPNPQGPALGRALRAWLETGTTWHRPVVEERVADPDDNSVRYLFRAADGVRFEAVRIGLEAAGRFTVCLSSQAGCAMACDFCATGRLGLVRNLTAAEIVGQLLVLRDEAPGRVSGAVFMGQGEPFHNYDEVMRSFRLLIDEHGANFSPRRITLSTAGLVSGIEKLGREESVPNLAISLNATTDGVRDEIMPVNRKWNIFGSFPGGKNSEKRGKIRRVGRGER
jgi:adenine C2-methylase RlmN of 23S rRNA A2503 and tRNA A37